MREWFLKKVRRLLRIHSPSLHFLGLCWCQKKRKWNEPIGQITHIEHNADGLIVRGKLFDDGSAGLPRKNHWR